MTPIEEIRYGRQMKRLAQFEGRAVKRSWGAARLRMPAPGGGGKESPLLVRARIAWRPGMDAAELAQVLGARKTAAARALRIICGTHSELAER